MSNLPSRSKRTTLAIFAASAFFSIALLAPAQAQDWKPGDPIPFGAAHKSMFDTSTPAGIPGSSRVMTPGTASGASSSASGTVGINPATSAAASAQPNAMDNFLNSRSIEWKPGDPVSFGAVHHPAATGKSINGDNNPSAVETMPSGFNPAQVPSSSPSPVIGAVNAPLQDLAPAPSSSPSRAGQGIVPAVTAATPSTMPGWAPVVPGTTGFSPANGGGSLPPSNPTSKKNKANKHNADQQTASQQQQKSNTASNQKSGSSGNIFSRAFHRMFGGN